MTQSLRSRWSGIATGLAGSPTLVAALVALWLSLTANLPFAVSFYRSDAAGTGAAQIFFAFTGWLLGFAVVALPLVLLAAALPLRATKSLLMLVLLVCAPMGYFGNVYGTQMDRTMFESMLATHRGEAIELLGWRLALWVACIGLIPAWWVWRTPLRSPVSWRKAMLQSTLACLVGSAVVAGLALVEFKSLASALRNRSVSFYAVAPVNLVFASISHWRTVHQTVTVRAARGTDAQMKYALPKHRLVVLVLGETARAQNYSLDGYHRETNPRMRAERALYFTGATSCGTATADSVPCIFSGLGRGKYGAALAKNQETLVDVVRRSGTKVIWRDNDGGCKGVCDAAEVENVTDSTDPRFCRPGEQSECVDEILLDGLEQRLTGLDGDTLLVLHLKGSHGPAYYKRYPKAFEKFAPTCQSNELSACSTAELVNSYDNTILYTDHILGEVTGILKRLEARFATAMFYVSDHGESLGERGLYLHGAPYAIAPPEQTRIPMLAWLSPQFIALERWSEACLRSPLPAAPSHDNVYATVLGLLEIETREYDKAKDVFDRCDPH